MRLRRTPLPFEILRHRELLRRALGTVILCGAGSLLPSACGKKGEPNTPPTALRESPAPAPRVLPAAPVPRPLPPEDPATLAWPEPTPAARSLFEEGRRLVDRAATLYGSAARGGADAAALRALDEGDRAMLAGLEHLHRAEIHLPAFLAWHQETLLRPLARGDHAETARRAAFCLRYFPKDIFARHALLAALHGEGKNAAAVEVADSLLADRPNDTEAREVLAIALFRLESWKRATDEAFTLARATPEDTQAWRLAAESAALLGDKDRGLAAVDRLLALIGWPERVDGSKSETQKAIETAIKVSHRFQEWRELPALAARYIERNPNATWALTAAGIALLESGDPAGAESVLRRALTDDLDTEEERFHLGLALSKQGKLEAASRTFAELLAEDPWYERGYYQLGLCLARAGEKEKAEAFFTRARELAASDRDLRRERQHAASGDRVLAVRSRVRGLVARGQFAAAEAALRRPDLDREASHIVDRLAFFTDALRLEEAAAELERLRGLIGAKHQDVIAHGATIAWCRGDRDQAIAAMRSVASLPNAGEIWKIRLAEWLLETSAAEEAVKVLRASRESAADAEESFLLGRAYLAVEDPENAARLFESVSSGDTRRSDWRIDAWWALALARLGRLDEAEARLGSAGADGRGREVELAAREAVLDLALREGRQNVEEELDASRRALARARTLLPVIRALRESIARTPWPADHGLRLELADRLAEAGDIEQAIRETRLALTAEPGSTRALEKLVDGYDAPGDAFLRIAALRELVRARPGDAGLANRLRELEAPWFGTEVSATSSPPSSG